MTLGRRPEPHAEKCQEESERIPKQQVALYESRRHRIREQRISKILVKGRRRGHESKTPGMAGSARREASTTLGVCRIGWVGPAERSERPVNAAFSGRHLGDTI